MARVSHAPQQITNFHTAMGGDSDRMTLLRFLHWFPSPLSRGAAAGFTAIAMPLPICNAGILGDTLPQRPRRYPPATDRAARPLDGACMRLLPTFPPMATWPHSLRPRTATTPPSACHLSTALPAPCSLRAACMQTRRATPLSICGCSEAHHLVATTPTLCQQATGQTRPASGLAHDDMTADPCLHDSSSPTPRGPTQTGLVQSAA